MNIVQWCQRVSIGSVVAGTLVALTATAAFAYWTATGTGTGTAAAATTAQGVTITQTALSNWQPNETRNVSGSFNNPNSYTVTVNRPTITGFSVDSGHSANCPTSTFSIVSQPTSAATIDVASGNGNGSWSGAQVKMADTAADGCKGATVSIAYASN